MKKKKIFIFFSVLLVAVIGLFTISTIKVKADSIYYIPPDIRNVNYNQFYESNDLTKKFGNCNVTFNNGSFYFNGSTSNEYLTYYNSVGNYNKHNVYIKFNKIIDNNNAKMDNRLFINYNDNSPRYAYTILNTTEWQNINMPFNGLFNIQLLIKNNNYIYNDFQVKIFISDKTIEEVGYHPNLQYAVNEVGKDAYDSGYQDGYTQGYQDGYNAIQNLNKLGGFFKDHEYQCYSPEDHNTISSIKIFNQDLVKGGFKNIGVYNTADADACIFENSTILRVYFPEFIFYKDITLLSDNIEECILYYDGGDQITVPMYQDTGTYTSQLIDFGDMSYNLPTGYILMVDFRIINIDTWKDKETISISKQYDRGFNIGYDLGFNKGLLKGREEGYNKCMDEGTESPFKWLSKLGVFFGDILAIPIFGKFTIGGFVLIPLIFGVVSLLLGLFHKGGK